MSRITNFDMAKRYPKLMEDNARMRAVLDALDRSIIETKMTDGGRRKLRNLIRKATSVGCGNAEPGGEPIAKCKQGGHAFSRSMDQEYPRKCIKCGATEQASDKCATTPKHPVKDDGWRSGSSTGVKASENAGTKDE